MTGHRSRRSACLGFTLIEMLVVLSIIALVASVSVPLLRRPPESLRLEAAARTLAAALRASRAEAIARNADATLVLDAGQRTLQAGGTVLHLDDDVSIEMKLAVPERQSATAGAIRFFPDGMSSGGDIILRIGRREARIAVNWLTGEARIDLSGGKSS